MAVPPMRSNNDHPANCCCDSKGMQWTCLPVAVYRAFRILHVVFLKLKEMQPHWQEIYVPAICFNPAELHKPILPKTNLSTSEQAEQRVTGPFKDLLSLVLQPGEKALMHCCSAGIHLYDNQCKCVLMCVWLVSVYNKNYSQA
jgi:hypothetical protein